MIFVNKYIDICRINKLIPVFNFSGTVNLVRMSENISAEFGQNERKHFSRQLQRAPEGMEKLQNTQSR